MTKQAIAIIGAGPYGLSLAAHLAAARVEHRVFGPPMRFWSQIATAGEERYLKSYCFGTNISTPIPGYSFADYSRPRGLEVFEPCSIADFAAYGRWFQENVVNWAEPTNVRLVKLRTDGFALDLEDGRSIAARKLVIATGLSHFAHIPGTLGSLPDSLITQTGNNSQFATFKGRDVAVIGAGQSALEAAALLHEAGARPQLIIREESILWQTRVWRERNLWRRLRSPISGLGTGPKAWALTRFPAAMHYCPAILRVPFVRSHLPPEGAWWLRERVEHVVPVHRRTSVISAYERFGGVVLQVEKDGEQRQLAVDHVIAGTGYYVDVERLGFLESSLRDRIVRVDHAPKLSSKFESSISGLYFIGPSSSMSFGPLFRFVVGASYTAQTVAAHLTRQSGLK